MTSTLLPRVPADPSSTATVGGPPSPRSRARLAAWLLLGTAAGGGAGVMAGPTVVPDRSVGQATVLLEPLMGNAFAAAPPELVALQTEAHAPRSDAVVAHVSEDWDPALVASARSTLRVRVLDHTPALVLTLVGPRGEAGPLAQRWAQATLDVRGQRGASERDSRVPALDAAIASTETAVARAVSSESEVAAAPILVRRVLALTEELEQVKAAALHPGTVLSVSTRSDPGVALRRRGLAAGSALAGALAAVALLGASRRRHG